MAVTTRPTAITGRRPCRSDTRPQAGAISSWAREKAETMTPTVVAEAPYFVA